MDRLKLHKALVMLIWIWENESVLKIFDDEFITLYDKYKYIKDNGSLRYIQKYPADVSLSGDISRETDNNHSQVLEGMI